MNTPPGRIEYSRSTMKYRHYGKILEKMIKIAADMEEGKAKNHLIDMLTSQMKRSYIQWNKEVDDAKILQDLYELSDGKIKLDASTYSIPEVKTNGFGRKMKTAKVQRKR